jgi:hypothetical protein
MVMNGFEVEVGCLVKVLYLVKLGIDQGSQKGVSKLKVTFKAVSQESASQDSASQGLCSR